MKKLYISLATFFLFVFSNSAFSQDWVSMMLDPTVNFYDVQKAFNKWYQKNEKEIERERERDNEKNKNTQVSSQKGGGAGEQNEVEGAWVLYKRWEAFVEPRVYPTGDRMVMLKAMSDFTAQQFAMNGNSMQSKNGPNTSNQKSGPNNPNTQAGNWTLLGPANSVPTNGGDGRTNCVTIDPTNNNILYVCAPGGGLWKSTNGGTSWTMWNTDGLAAIGATDLVIDPTNTQIMYLASGDGEAGDTYSLGVLKSTNGGTTWNATGLNWNVTQGRTISKLLIDPSNTQIIHAATSNGIYRTTDGGTNWTQIMTGSWKDMEFMPGTPATIYATAYNPGSFWRSTNSGASYTQTTTGLPASGTIRFAIAVTPNNNNRIWLLAGNNTNYGFYGFYTSTNGGTSFTQVTVSSPTNLLGWASAGNDAGGQAWYDLSIACSPTNQNEVVVGGVNIWRTTNGGTNWTLNAHWTGTGAPYVHADQHNLVWQPGSGTTYYSCDDGGIFKTTNNGTAWTDISNNLQIAEMYRLSTSATNANLNLSGHQDNGTNRYNTGAWAEVIGGDGMECIIDWSNANTMYGELYYGDIRKSTNGGASFPTQIVSTGGAGVNANGNWVTPYIIHPTANQTLLVGKASIYRSTNGGTTWTALGATTGGTGNIVQLAYAPSNPNYIYAIKQNAIFVSSNGGTSFTNVTGTVPTSNAFTYITVSSSDPLKAYVTISGYTTANKVFQTTNAGTSWTNYTGTGLPNLPVNCIVYQNSTPDGVYIGTDVGVYYRDNTMTGWVPFYTGMPNVKVDELEIQYSAGKIRAATFGRGMWESNLYSSGSSAPVANYTSNYQSGCPGIQIQFTDLSSFSPTSWSWNFPGGTPATSTAQNPLITYNSTGTYPVSLWATNINGTDSVLHTWVTISGTIALPLVEGFQLAQFLPANWLPKDINNDGVFYQRSTTVGGYNSSTACAYFDNYTQDVAGARDEMWTPKYNLTTLSTCSCTFDIAYARYDATYSDTLEVLVSTNCGQTWTSVYLKGGTTLATAPDLTTAGFVPTAAQWRTETINLNAYTTATTFMMAFRNRGHYGQMMYIDNINITGAPSSGPPVAVMNASSTSICPNGCITFTDNSTNSPTSWSWTFPSGSPASSTAQNPGSVCWTVAGTYTVSLTATNSNGSSTTTQVITVNAAPTVSHLPAAPSYCTGGSVSITASGATTYAWSPATGLSATTGATVTANPTATTTYTITGTNAAGCTNTNTVTVTVNPNPTVTASPSAPSYCSGGNVSITASGGNTYAWAPATGLSATTGATVTASPTVTTTYTITGTSAAGCTGTVNVTVTVNPTPTVTVAPAAPTICNSGSVSVTASGGNTYAWAPATGLSATTGSTVTANPTVTTTYTVTGTSASGCTNTATVTVTVNPVPTVTVAPAAPTICSGSSVSITASGANTYAWSPATGLSATTGATVIANPTVTTTYTVTGTSAAGCTNTASVTVTVNPSPTVTHNPAAPTICNGGNVVITASGANTYAWSPATALSATTGSTVTASPTVTTTYTITGTGANGCTNTNTVTVSVGTSPTVTVAPAAPTICSGSSVSITASGALTYAWSPATGLSATTGATVTANPTATTTYTITGTNAAGCTNTASVTVTVNPAPTVTYSPASPTICNGGNVVITASGANTYVWSPATALSATTGATVTANPTVTTTYTITGTAANGCTATNTVTVSVGSNPNVTVAPGNSTICSGSSINLTASGALTYVWAPAASLSASTGATVTASPTVTTTYTCTGTNAAGCTGTRNRTITVNNGPTVTFNPAAPTICNGGSIAISASGATSYAWSPATGLSATTGANVTANPTVTTTYTVTGTAPNGCTRNSMVTVTVNPSPTVTFSPASPTICNGGNVVVTASGANTYAWSPATGLSATTGATVTASPTVTTTYTITGTSAAGCTGTNTVTVTIGTNPTVTISPSSSSICNGGSVNVTASGALTYAWSPATGLSATTGATVTATPTATTTYTVTGTNAAGCTANSTVTITINPAPTVTLSPSSPSYCQGGSVSITASGGASYVWSPATDLSASTGATVVANPTATATYTVTVTDVNGCTNTNTVTVTVNPPPVITASATTPTICSGGNTNLTGNGGSTYVWSPASSLSASTGTTVNATPTASTTYTVIGTDINGCTNTDTVDVIIGTPNASAGSDVSICMGDNTTLNATGGGTYSWAPATGLSATNVANPVANPTVTTSYTVTVTNGPGCTATDIVVVTVNPLPPIPGISQNGNVLTSTAATTYQWYLNNVIIPGATNQTYTMTQSGNYSVCITDVNGCTSCSKLYPTNLTGLDDILTNGTLSVFPNPNQGEFDINFDLDKKDNYSIEITNELGEIVYKENLQDFIGHYSHRFDFRDQGAGMFMFTLKNSVGRSVKKVIVY